MIGIVDVAVQAHNPEMPLYPMKAFAGSPSSIRVRNVPRQIGSWKITNVVFTAVYPDGQTKSAQCVPVNNVWVGTIDGSDATGTTANGYTIFASGIDENGNQASNYVLGKGDVEILDNSGLPDPSQPVHFVTTDEMDAALSGKADLSAVNGYLPLSGGTMDNGAVVTLYDEQENLALIIDGQNGRLVGNFNTLDNFGGFSFDGHARYTLGDRASEGFEVQPVEQNNMTIMRSGDVYAVIRYNLGPTTTISTASQDTVNTATVNYGSAAMLDRAINKVVVTASLDQLRVSLPAAINGKARDFGLRVEVGSGSTALAAPSLVLVAPTGESLTFENPDGAMPTLASGTASAKGVSLLYFTETAAGTFLVKGEQVKEVS